MKKSELKQLIVESIQEYIKSIDEAGDLAALEAKINKINEEIESRQGKISRVTEIGDLAEFVDQNKVKEIQKEISLLERGKDKYSKQLEKMKSGKKSKEPIKDTPEKEELDEKKQPVKVVKKTIVKKAQK